MLFKFETSSLLGDYGIVTLIEGIPAGNSILN